MSYFDLLQWDQTHSILVPMPSILYQRNFIPDGIYHLCNRGALGSEIFRDAQDYQTFTFILSYYLRIPDGKPLSYLQSVQNPYARQKPDKVKAADQVHLLAYSLLPTRFNLILEEKLGAPAPGISNLMKRLSVTYAMYYNKKYGKDSSLFAGKYKVLKVESNEHLLELSKYLHKLGQDPTQSSYNDYLKSGRSWVHTDQILTTVRLHNTLSYKTFVEDTPANTTFLGKLTLA